MSDKNIYEETRQRRKDQIKAGVLPEWFTTNALLTFEKKYLYKAENYKEQIERICSTLSKHTDDPDTWESKFFEIIWNGWLALSTPVMANTGTNRGMPVSCSGGVTKDSVEGFFDSYKEVAVLSKNGFGTSSYVGSIRPRGSKISNGRGKADGSIPVIKMLRNTVRQISQGSARRGAGAWYLDIDHDDFYELCDFLKNNPDDLNIGWNIPNSFIDRLKSGDQEAISRFNKALSIKMVTGKGYFFFVDRANELATVSIKNSKIAIKASNLCIAGDQRVPSQFGYLTARELNEIDEDLILTDGHVNVSSSKMKLRERDVDTYKVTLENGMSLTTTDYHGFPVMEVKSNGKNIITKTPMKDLKIGDKVAVQIKKGIFGPKSMEDEAFLLGQYQSDGTQNKGSIHLCLWEDQFDLIDEIEERFSRVHYKYGCNKLDVINVRGGSKVGEREINPPRFKDSFVSQSDVSKKSLISRTLKKALNFEKGYIPDWIWESDEETQWQYVRGLYYADGSAYMSKSKGNPIQISYADISYEFLQDLQMLLQNLGMQTSIRVASLAGQSLFPDGKGGKKLYDTKDCWRLLIGNKGDCLEFNKKTGFLDRKGVFVEDRNYRDNTKKSYKVSSIEYIGKQDVYCPTVDTEDHIFVAQGMKTYNCVEIALPADEENTFTCVLSSMNLSKFDEWKDTDAVFTATVFLDCVAEEAIRQAREIPSLHRVVRFTENFRALGLGALGFHTYLQDRMIPFDSMEAQLENRKIFKYIQEKSIEASKWMAKNWGEPLHCKGTGMRNATLMAIAPNTTSALICGSVSQGIEPFYKNVFTQGSAAGDLYRVNPSLLRVLKEKNRNNKKVINSIIDNKGSVSHLEFLTDEEKEVFKTAFEIDQRSIINLAAQRQKYIDQGQSLNLFFSADESEEYIGEIHREAFLNPWIKSLYYIRSEAGVQAAKQTECEACEG